MPRPRRPCIVVHHPCREFVGAGFKPAPTASPPPHPVPHYPRRATPARARLSFCASEESTPAAARFPHPNPLPEGEGTGPTAHRPCIVVHHPCREFVGAGLKPAPTASPPPHPVPHYPRRATPAPARLSFCASEESTPAAARFPHPNPLPEGEGMPRPRRPCIVVHHPCREFVGAGFKPAPTASPPPHPVPHYPRRATPARARLSFCASEESTPAAARFPHPNPLPEGEGTGPTAHRPCIVVHHPCREFVGAGLKPAPTASPPPHPVPHYPRRATPAPARLSFCASEESTPAAARFPHPNPLPEGEGTGPTAHRPCIVVHHPRCEFVGAGFKPALQLPLLHTRTPPPAPRNTRAPLVILREQRIHPHAAHGSTSSPRAATHPPPSIPSSPGRGPG